MASPMLNTRRLILRGAFRASTRTTQFIILAIWPSWVEGTRLAFKSASMAGTMSARRTFGPASTP